MESGAALGVEARVRLCKGGGAPLQVLGSSEKIVEKKKIESREYPTKIIQLSAPPHSHLTSPTQFSPRIKWWHLLLAKMSQIGTCSAIRNLGRLNFRRVRV